jgi:integrase
MARNGARAQARGPGPADGSSPGMAATVRRKDKDLDSPALRESWMEAQGDWLAVLERRNRYTARAYATALADFREFLYRSWDVFFWRVEPAHIRAWQERMKSDGKSAATIAQRVAAVSSFYAFVIGEKRQLGNGMGIYVDARNTWRSNPCRAAELKRPKQRKYAKCRPVPAAIVEAMLRRINTTTATGARDYALLLTLLYTGWPAAELLSLRWDDITQNPDRPGEYFCHCPQSRAAGPSVLPAKCYEAIIRYLRTAERAPEHLQPGEYLWRPLRTRGCANLLHVRELAANRPITTAQALNVLRKRLRAAGLAEYGTYTLQSLRSTFAQTYAQTRPGDVAGLSRRLHHTSVATTQAYLKALDSAMDDYSADFERVLRV